MNTILNFLKLFFIAVVSAVILFSSYFFIFLGGDDSKLSFLGVTSPEAATVTTSAVLADQLNAYLEELKSVEIDTDFFQSPEFRGLENFKRGLPTLQAGRANPFEPIY
jgi:predicted glycosyltransferase involved in capsule biosynthesis